MYAEIIEKLHASNMKLFTYPSKFEVFTNLLKLTNQILENFITSNPGAYGRTKTGEDENEKDPQ